MPTYTQFKKEINKRIKNKERLDKRYPLRIQPILIDLIESKNNNLLKLILKHDSKKIVEKSASLKKNFLFHAIYHDNLPAVKIFLSYNEEVNARTLSDHTPLSQCVGWKKENGIAITKLLLTKGANPNVTSESLLSLIGSKLNKPKYYLQENRNAIAKLLIVFGAQTDLDIKNYSPIITNRIKTTEKQLYKKRIQEFFEFITSLTDQRNSLIEQVKNNKAVEYENLHFPLAYTQDTDGNNLMHYALENENWPVADRLLYLSPGLLTRPNFENKLPIDFIKRNINIATWLYQKMDFQE